MPLTWPDTLTLLEWSATAMTALSVLLAARRHIATWPIGIIGSALYLRLFHSVNLYAEVVLQLFFIGTSLWGWREWLRQAGGHASQPVRMPAALPRRDIAWLAALGIAVALAHGALLALWTQAYAPFWDSAVLAASVIAQWLLMQGRRETWLVWILVNSLSVPLYLSRELHVTAGLYALFWLNAWHGWWVWGRPDRARPRGGPA